MEHFLKIQPQYFEEVRNGNKSFEIRKNDRDFKVGDTLYLQEYNPLAQEYTGEVVKEKLLILLIMHSKKII